MRASTFERLCVCLLWLFPAAAVGGSLTGTVTLSAAPAKGFVVREDRFNYASSGAGIREFPAIEFTVVQDGRYLLPVEQGIRDLGHPHWEVAMQPGHIQRANESKAIHAALPIALIERNANCTHNGVLSWQLDDAGIVSEALWQITSETCAYFKFDLWATAEGAFRTVQVPNADRLRREFRAHRQARLPVEPIEHIGEHHDGVDASAFGAVGEMRPDDMSVYGFVVDGVHFRSGCMTRHGVYPFCDELLLPSYSTAKSIFAGLATMRLEKLHPGSSTEGVAALVPACNTADWRDVTIEHALDMSTGNYDDPGFEVDEASEAHVAFLYAPTHAEKIRAACSLFPRRADPGTVFNYHTSDTYIAGTAMRALLELASDNTVDLYEMLLAEPVWRELQLSPIARETRKTHDGKGQAFAGWGLTFLPDDVARIGNWLNAGNAMLNGHAMLDDELFEAAMQRKADDRGLPAGGPGFRYNNGFWAHDIAEYIGCDQPVWVPFMSGYGGISVVLFPNGTTYYYFSDGYAQRWREAAVAANTIKSMCQ